MRKLLNNPWFVTAMSLLAVALAWSSLSPTNPGITNHTAPAVVATTEPAVEQALPGGEPANVPADGAIKLFTIPKSSRDPFATRGNQTTTTTTEVVAQPDLMDSAHLTGIWTQNGATFLLLNGQVVQVGDTLGRLTVESASQDGIWLTHWKGRDFLTVGNSFTLKTPARRVSNP